MGPRRSSLLNTPMVIALMAFAIVAFLLLIDISIFPPKKATTTVKNTNTTTNQNLNTNSTGTTTGTFETNTNSTGSATE